MRPSPIGKIPCVDACDMGLAQWLLGVMDRTTPPSARTGEPVMALASCEHRKATISAISWGRSLDDRTRPIAFDELPLRLGIVERLSPCLRTLLRLLPFVSDRAAP